MQGTVGTEQVRRARGGSSTDVFFCLELEGRQGHPLVPRGVSASASLKVSTGNKGHTLGGWNEAPFFKAQVGCQGTTGRILLPGDDNGALITARPEGMRREKFCREGHLERRVGGHISQLYPPQLL